MVYIGIDPGKKGGYALLGSDGSINAYPWDNEGFVKHMRGVTVMRDLNGEMLVACVEKVNAMPGQGVTSMFSFGSNYGYIQGVLGALGIPYQLVSPRVWKKSYGLDSSKQRSIEVCQKLFPDLDLLATDRSRVPSDGLAEAALIALYAKRHF